MFEAVTERYKNFNNLVEENKRLKEEISEVDMYNKEVCDKIRFVNTAVYGANQKCDKLEEENIKLKEQLEYIHYQKQI